MHKPRAQKRAEAEARNTLTPPERRRAHAFPIQMPATPPIDGAGVAIARALRESA